MSKSKELLTDMNDVELERLLTSKASAAPLNHEGGDHLIPYTDIPRPGNDDLATPEAAQGWAEREIVKATPRAAQEMINQLRRGNNKERMEAAKQIMDRSGMQGGQRVTNTGPVIVLTADALAALPWAKHFVPKEKEKEKVVEGTVLSSRTE